MSGPWLRAPPATCALCGWDTGCSVHGWTLLPLPTLSPGSAQDGGAWPRICCPRALLCPFPSLGPQTPPSNFENSHEQPYLSIPGRREESFCLEGVASSRRGPAALKAAACGPQWPISATARDKKQEPAGATDFVSDDWVLGFPPFTPPVSEEGAGPVMHQFYSRTDQALVLTSPREQCVPGSPSDHCR